MLRLYTVLWMASFLCTASFPGTASFALADGFTFTIGSAVATQDFRLKGAAFAFRTEGCADPAKSQTNATAEGIVKGKRKSLALQIVAAPKPGVYAVLQGWPPEGDRVLNLNGTCGDEKAGALIPIGTRGFIRESSKFLPRPATDAEIEKALKALAQEKAQGEKK
jgi:hypothetical protein